MSDPTVQAGAPSDAASSQPSGGAGTATAPETTSAAGPAVAGTTEALKVNFQLETEDQLRMVSFGLEEDLKGTDPIWTIHFQLQERDTTTDDFISVVTLDITFDDEELRAAAHATASGSGLTEPQAAHVVGPAADDAKASKLPLDSPDFVDPDDAKETVKNTFAA